MPESLISRKRRAAEIVRRLEAQYPSAEIALHYQTPFQLLVATILAAQCTDERVNMVTPTLFQRYPTPAAFLETPIEDLERMIFQTGFYRNKAKSIRGACEMIVEEFGGNVPGTMEELLRLPGVGRKTANVLLGHCFNTPGIVVDTHVKRISNLLGLVKSDDPKKIEQKLMTVIPGEKWIIFSHLLATHGRAVCVARRPKCAVCVVADLCPGKTQPLRPEPRAARRE